MIKELGDSFGRRFSYLRLSVTDACNFSCVYCLPAGYTKPQGKTEQPLSLEEIINLVTAFSELGIWKLRFTGGEPTVRRDLLEIVEAVGGLGGIRRMALSTNGYRLKQLAGPFLQRGLRHFNVSLDSLNSKKFKAITGRDVLGDVLSGIDRLLELGGAVVKVNTVLLKDQNLSEISTFMKWIRDKPITVRWIEMMPTSFNQGLLGRSQIRVEAIRSELNRLGWIKQPRKDGDGPAEEYFHSDSIGKMGVIAPYEPGFCGNCNRLRVTSIGQLRLCLFGKGGTSIRHLLESPDQKEDLKNRLCSLVFFKESSHKLMEGNYGDNRTFSAMGG